MRSIPWREVARLSLFCIGVIGTFLWLGVVGAVDIIGLAQLTTQRFGVPMGVAMYLTICGIPAMWSLMLQRSFLTDGTVGSELGVVLHLFYLAYGMALCLVRGLEVCIPMFLLYWPFVWVVRGIEWALYRTLDRFG
jgi:hypothetical protein